MRYALEEELRKPVHDYFRTKKYSVFDEVRLFSRDIDIVAKRRNEIIAVELKLRDWKKAINQACLNQRVSDYSYVALPEPLWNRIDRDVYTISVAQGIGLLSVHGVARQIMRPERSKRIQPHLRRRFLRNLQDVKNC
jgi:hypothetical protein